MNAHRGTILPFVYALLVLTAFVFSAFGDAIVFPDPSLDTVIRATLQKPSGALT